MQLAPLSLIMGGTLSFPCFDIWSVELGKKPVVGEPQQVHTCFSFDRTSGCCVTEWTMAGRALSPRKVVPFVEVTIGIPFKELLAWGRGGHRYPMQGAGEELELGPRGTDVKVNSIPGFWRSQSPGQTELYGAMHPVLGDHFRPTAASSFSHSQVTSRTAYGPLRQRSQSKLGRRSPGGNDGASAPPGQACSTENTLELTP